MATTWKAPTWRMPNEKNQSKFENYGLTFDGNTEYINCGNVEQLKNASVITWNCWINFASANFNIVFGKGASPDVIQFYTWASGVGYFFLKTANVGTTAVINPFIGSLVNLDEWNMFTIVFDGTQTGNDRLKIYLNGGSTNIITSYGGTPPATLPNTTDDFFIGNGTNGDFVGSMSQFSIFDYTLSESQISSLYNSGSPINPMTLKPAPVAYYPLGGNASTGGDSTNTLSVPNVAVPDASVFDFVPNDYIDCGNISTLNGASTATFSAWFNTDVTSALILMGTDTQFYIQVWAANNRIDFITPAATQYRTTAPTINDGEWYHLTIVFNKDGGSHTERYKGYINGVYYANERTTSTSDALPTTSNSFELGKYGSIGSQFNGKMSNIAIWNSDQSSEISNIYNSGVPATTYTNTPTAWYKLDQSANWEADTAGNWQIPDAVSSYPQSFNFSQNKTITTPNAFSDIITGSNKMGVCTISYWYKSSGTGQRDYMSLNDETSALSAKFRVDSSNRFYYLETNNYLRFVAQTNLDEWNHHCWVFNSATSYSGTAGQTNGDLQFYVNGVVQAVDFDFSATPANSPWDRFNIARADQTSGAGLDFEMSNLMLYSTNFSASQVLQLYNNGTPLTTAIATDNLKGWWKLSDNEIWDGTNWSVENQKYPAGFDSSLIFNQTTTGDRVQIPHSTSLDITSNLSVSFWYKQNGAVGDASAVSKDAFGSARSWFLWVNNFGGTNFPTVGVFDSSNNSYSVPGTIRVDDGNWHHIVMTYEPSVAVRLYIDGQLNNSNTTSIPASIASEPTVPIVIGESHTSTFYPVRGFINNVAIFNTTLDSAAVTALYNNGTPETSISSSPVSWWKLNNLTTGIQDSVGSNNGSITGNVSKRNIFVSTKAGISSGMTEQNLVNNNVSVLNGESSDMDTSNLVTSTLTRQVPYNSYSLNFDSASSDYIDASLTSDVYACSLWFKPNTAISSGSTLQYLINFGGTWNGINLGEMTGSLTGEVIIVTDASVAGRSAYTGGTISTDWHHLCVNWSGSVYEIWLDGVNVQNATTGTPQLISATDLQIGRRSTSPEYYFDGSISNISIFNEALTSTEVMKLYNSGVPGDLSSFNPSPTAWWSLGSDSYFNGSNWICPDLVGSNNGTSANMDDDALIGDAPNSTANGTSTNMAIDANLTGSAPNSSNNSFSVNMDYTDRETSVPG